MVLLCIVGNLLWDVEAHASDIAILPGGSVICTRGGFGGLQVYDKKSGEEIKHPISDMCKGDILSVSVGDDGVTVAAVAWGCGEPPDGLHIYTSVNGRWMHHMIATCDSPLSVACVGDGHFIVGSFSGAMYKYNTHGEQIWVKKLSLCPWFISTDHKNRILVSYNYAGHVTVYNVDGEEMFSFSAATDQRKMKPRGLYVWMTRIISWWWMRTVSLYCCMILADSS